MVGQHKNGKTTFYAKCLGRYLLIFLLCLCFAYAQQGGRVFLQHFSGQTYLAGPQNWHIVQDQRGIIYIANNEGVLEYDANGWRKTPGTDAGARCLAVDSNGRIWAGGNGDIGYLESDSVGSLFFQSILQFADLDLQNVGSVRSIHVINESIFFQSERGVYQWKNQKLKKVFEDEIELRSYPLRNQIILDTKSKGLLSIQEESYDSFPETNRFNELTLSLFIPLDSNLVLAGSITEGLVIFDSLHSSFHSSPALDKINTLLKQHSLYHGIRLSSGDFALATLSGGILILNKDFELIRHINSESGLPNQTVHYLFEDKQRGLWAALNKGVVRISLVAPFTFWGEEEGMDATVHCLTRYKGQIYAGTSLGLYRLQQGRFQPISSRNEQVFDLKEFNNQLFMATGSGLYRLEEDKFVSVNQEKRGPLYVLYVSRYISPKTLFAGGQNGLYVLSNTINGWLLAPNSDIQGNIRSIADPKEDVLWLGTSNKGYIKYNLRSRLSKSQQRTEHFDSLNGQQWLGTHRVFLLGDSLIFSSSREGAMSLKNGKFVSHPGLGTKNTKFWVAATESQDQIWVWESTFQGVFLKWYERLENGDWDEKSNNLRFISDQYSLLNGAIFPQDSEKIWLGGASGVYLYFPDKDPGPEYYSQGFEVLIRKIVHDQSKLVYAGANQKVPPELTLAFTKNAISFEYAATSLEIGSPSKFSYLLEGYDDRWSGWTLKTEKDYTNLPAGDYTFRVRSQNTFGQMAESEGINFSILAPWYQKWWAYLLYALFAFALVASIVWIFIRNQTRKLIREQQLNERLRVADRMKDQFLANTSHELRTPLNGIIGLSETLFENTENTNQKQDLSLIIASGKRLASLINDILDFSKLRQEEIVLRKKAVSLHGMAENMLRMHEPLVKDKDIDLQNRVPKSLVPIMADENRLQQIFYNLIGNAVKFTEGGFVRISAEQNEDETLSICVSDSGIGIDPSRHEEIFHPFRQGDGSITREYGGTGLGLSITRQLVEAHNSKIWVESNPDSGEKGAKFYFTLPTTDQTPEELESENSASLSPTPVVKSQIDNQSLDNSQVIKGASVLIVDDEPINHQVLRRQLKDEAIELVSAMSGEEALRLLNSTKRFDLVLLDIMMPRMNGYEVCREIRKKFLPNELPIIMLTARNQPEDLLEGFQLGANDYLTKPYSKTEFLARVRTHLNLNQIYQASGRFVPSAFLRALGKEMITEVTLGDHTHQEVSVLFTDIRDYTGLAESMTPEENFSFVNAYAGRMGPIIQQHDGFVQQYLGDGIMAIFQHSPLDALQAAIAMQEKVRQYNQERVQKGRLPLRVGMGIHTGSLIMGIIGDEFRTDPATISDTVNTASRMEGLTKHFDSRILISEKTFEGIDLDSADQELNLDFRFLGKVKLKGKNAALGIYECIQGYTQEERVSKKANQSRFEEALESYYLKKFEIAIQQFSTVLRDDPHDGAAQYFYQKAIRYANMSLDEEWSGVEMMDTK